MSDAPGAQRAAEAWPRLGARVLDVVIVGGPVWLLGLPFLVGFTNWVGTPVATAPPSPFEGWPFWLFATAMVVIGPVAWAGYSGWYGGVRGATIGQRAVGIRVVREGTGSPLGFGRYVAREVVFAASALVVLGFVSLFIDASGALRGWHDRAVGSRVVDA